MMGGSEVKTLHWRKPSLRLMKFWTFLLRSNYYPRTDGVLKYNPIAVQEKSQHTAKKRLIYLLAVVKPCAVKFLLQSLGGSRRQIDLQYKLGQPRARVPSPAVQLFQVLQRFSSSPPLHFRHFHDDPDRLCLTLPGLHSSKETQRKKPIRPSRERRTKLFLAWLLPYLLQVYNHYSRDEIYQAH